MKENIYFEKIDERVKLKLMEDKPEQAPIHEVKSWSHFFQAIKSGRKVHDLRKNDRGYNVGDLLLLREYDFVLGRYTGDTIRAEITYITDSRVPCAFSSAVLARDYCILSLKVHKC